MTNYQQKYDSLVDAIHQGLFSKPNLAGKTEQEVVQEAEQLIGRILFANELLNLVEGSEADDEDV